MHTLTTFFIGVAVALAIVLCLTYFVKGGIKFNSTLIFVAGFVIGMVTLYIKVKLLGFN
jgi:hypothetical protein